MFLFLATEKCGATEVSLEAVGRTDKQIVATQDTDKGTVFRFDNIMPGKYKGRIQTGAK